MGKQQTGNGVFNVGAKVINLTQVDERVTKLEATITDMDTALDEAVLLIPTLLKQVKEVNAKLDTLKATNVELTDKLKTLMKKS